MIQARFDTTKFNKIMNNISQYSYGFIDGIEKNAIVFNIKLAELTEEALKKYIDTRAKANPQSLHHVYEWNNVGNPSARLFEITSTSSKNLISFNGKFLQSTSVSDTSEEPFYDKANVMENRIAIEVQPQSSNVLSFEDEGQQVFTVKSIVIENPGGDSVAGSFGQAVSDFFDIHFTSSFLKQIGFFEKMSNPQEYYQYFNSGSKVGRSAGTTAGKKYMSIQGEMF